MSFVCNVDMDSLMISFRRAFLRLFPWPYLHPLACFCRAIRWMKSVAATRSFQRLLQRDHNSTHRDLHEAKDWTSSNATRIAEAPCHLQVRSFTRWSHIFQVDHEMFAAHFATMEKATNDAYNNRTINDGEAHANSGKISFACVTLNTFGR